MVTASDKGKFYSGTVADQRGNSDRSFLLNMEPDGLSIVGMEATIKRAFAKETCAYWLSSVTCIYSTTFQYPACLTYGTCDAGTQILFSTSCS